MRRLIAAVALAGFVAFAAAMPVHANGNMPGRASDMQEQIPQEARHMMQAEVEADRHAGEHQTEELPEGKQELNESSDEANNETRNSEMEGPPTEFPGNGKRRGPPAFVAEMIPSHVLDRAPVFVFGK